MDINTMAGNVTTGLATGTMDVNNVSAMVENGHSFRLPEMVGSMEFSKDELADDMTGLQLNFQKVKIPSGGTLQFELPGDDPENPDYVKTIEGVLLYNHAAGALWAEDSEKDEDALPLCSSADGQIGAGEPGGVCASCHLNAWGSGLKGKGKACKNMRVLYLLRDGEYMPIQLTLSPMSIRPYTDFFNAAFASRRRGTCGSIIQIGLKRANNGKDDYSVATFKKLYDFTGEQLAQIKAYADNFRAEIKDIIQQRTVEAATRMDNTVNAYKEAPTYATVFGGNDNGGFSIGTNIDGDRMALPA